MTVTSEPHSESTEGRPRVRDNRTAHPAVAFATQRLCPYLIGEGAGWRSATASRDHRCGAVTPPVPLAIDKQRRLCLVGRHSACPTFLAAADQAGHVPALTPVGDSGARPGRRPGKPGGQAVTRWSIVRTAPVLLDRGALPGALALGARMRRSPQLLLVAVLAVAFVAIAAARLSSGSAAVGRSAPSPSAVAAVPPPSVTEPAPVVSPSAAAVAATSAPTLPPTEVSRTYKVKRGDTLYVIARRFGTSVGAIQRLNGLGRSTTIHAGDVLKIP